MIYKFEELHLNNMLLSGSVEVIGIQWEEADKEVGIMSGSYAGVKIEYFEELWMYDHIGDCNVQMLNPEKLFYYKTLKEVLVLQILEDDKFIDELCKDHELQEN